MRAPRVTTASEAAARDHAAIHGGTPSFVLMLQAGTVAAAYLLREHADRLSHGVALFAGTGNNGGDAYIIAAQLARAGVAARVHAALPPKSADAHRAAQLAAPYLEHGAPTGHERIVVDGLLGTGHEGEFRGGIWAECARLAMAQDGGALVVALDVPSGLNATTGDVAHGSVAADVTLSFGTYKRGALLQRRHCGQLVLLDIGLHGFADVPGHVDDDAWRWADARQVHELLPDIAWNAHKGTRGRVGVAGGDVGMAGAIVLAARAALATGAGLVHAIVDEPSILPVQALVPQALAHRWPALPTSRRADERPEGVSHPTPSQANADPRYDALAIGPGLGRGKHSATVMQRLLDEYRGTPMVLDADALWLAADAANALGTDTASMLRHWTRDTEQVVCTPHPGEFARLLGVPLPDDVEERARQLQQFATRANCTVLLKGTPTLIADATGEPLWVVPHGTPMLATGGSGDCLSGIIATLLAQGCSARDAAVVGATVHGRAAEAATVQLGGVRGGTLDDVLAALPLVWTELGRERDTAAPGVLAVLPAV
ncbi:bifunctional ADP-dependent NAD(P)H-hydrate dehydratase/NAD(P)H-hydrate epimerase [Gemmatimonas phototrophica]|uniref:bifunctional ADP-dependent NAD(P)H-hydrate dehydratase/NAD(P)H-hydrate epimerase n=1 Tax=Gemmatimonas phototrophica TaxID=1379270 RepID=UPI0006A6CEE3|nr:bifunctional ADP-dependent NAD(P)H-hydrate dehydratase/NAD(P)H-hydrate epimerase [Gemmatimonas phototrophica]